MLFIAMGAGLIAGMGYLAYALLFAVVMALVSMLYTRLDFGSGRNGQRYKTVTVTIPEDLNYTEIFTDIFNTYTRSHALVRVKTTNLGSLYKLTYEVELKDAAKEKEMIDQVRCRNGNLEIAVSRQETAAEL